MSDRPIGIIVSEPKPLPGQGSRASGNFSTVWFGGAHQMLVEVTVDGKIDDTIVFKIAEDKSGSDPVRADNVRNNTQLPYIESNSLYIIVKQCPPNKNFKVTINPYVAN